MLFPTSLVGSYPQPDWLIDRERLGDRFPPRVRARELWRVSQDHLAEAQRDATLLAILAQEQAGLDILTDGEICRESYSNRFATALDGVDIDNPGTALDRSGHPNPVPRVTGPIRRRHAGRDRGRDVPPGQHRQDHQDHRAGPVHHGPAGAERLLREHRGARARLRRGGQRGGQGPVRGRGRHRPAGRALPAGPPGGGPPLRRGRAQPGARGRHRHHGGAPVLRLRGDHPRPPVRATRSCPNWPPPSATRCRSRPPSPAWTARCWPRWPARPSSWACSTSATTPWRRADDVAARVRRALPYVAAERLVLAPDCGMKYLPRDVAFGKLSAMTQAAAGLRAELGAS